MPFLPYMVFAKWKVGWLIARKGYIFTLKKSSFWCVRYSDPQCIINFFCVERYVCFSLEEGLKPCSSLPNVMFVLILNPTPLLGYLIVSCHLPDFNKHFCAPFTHSTSMSFIQLSSNVVIGPLSGEPSPFLYKRSIFYCVIRISRNSVSLNQIFVK